MSMPNSLRDGRRSPREAVSWKTQVRSPTLRPSDALIVNLSPHGCMMRCAEEGVVVGEGITVGLPLVGDWVGRVIWSLGGRIGMEFHVGVPIPSYLEMLGLMTHDPAGMNGI